ncbi:MAG: FKBP-type peptidyl-prolyl cis-trans isomerase [Nitrososphaerales archaeon]
MPLENGTLILADYTGRVKDTGQIIETTRKTDAESAGNADPTRTYEPKLIAVGEGWVLKGLDEALGKTDPGQTLDVELAPEKAFGARDPNRISRIPVRKFGEKAGDLSVGSEVEVDNRIGIIRSLESGRAIVDFNPRYAGKTLLYNVEIKERLDARDAKVGALIRRRLPIEKTNVKFEVSDAKIRVTVPKDYFLLEGLQIIKRAISTDLFKFIKPLENVEFVEEYENPEAKKKEEKPVEAQQQVVPEEKKTEVSREGEPKKQEVPPKKAEHKEHAKPKHLKKKSKRHPR